MLEGLKGKHIAEVCTEHEIRQSLDYQWQDQFLANAAYACESQRRGRRDAHLGR
jgi:hypothetical protein